MSSPETDATKARLESAYRNLARVIDWINNADTKGLILLTFQGVLSALLLASSPIVSSVVLRNHNVVWAWILSILAGTFATVFLTSILFLLSSLLPRTKVPKGSEDEDSLIFFGTIARMTLDNFIARASALSIDEITTGLLKQVFINSLIANKKFGRLQIAMRLSFVSLLLLVGVAGASILEASL